MAAPKLSKSKYLITASQSELEQIEMQRLAKAADLGAELADLAQGLGLREQFAALFRQKLFAKAFKEMIRELAEATLAWTLIEARRPGPSQPEIEAGEMLDKLVQERAIEVLREPTSFLEPDMQPQTLVAAIMARQGVWGRRKHAAAFAEWGCRVCGRKDVAHESAGHCDACYMRWFQRYRKLQKQWESEHPIEQLGIDPKSDAVKRLLGKLR